VCRARPLHVHRASIARAAPFSAVRGKPLKSLTSAFALVRTTLNALWPNLQAGGRGFESHRLHRPDQGLCPQNGGSEGPEVDTREHLGNIRSRSPWYGWVRGQDLPPKLRTGWPAEQLAAVLADELDLSLQWPSDPEAVRQSHRSPFSARHLKRPICADLGAGQRPPDAQGVPVICAVRSARRW
jgi:hypothetical protein